MIKTNVVFYLFTVSRAKLIKQSDFSVFFLNNFSQTHYPQPNQKNSQFHYYFIDNRPGWCLFLSISILLETLSLSCQCIHTY